jgi:protein TonB
MFEDSLLESGGRNSRLHRRGPWATVLSLVIQCFLVALLVLIPLVKTNVLPQRQLVTFLVAPPPPPPPPPPPAAKPAAKPVPKRVVRPKPVPRIDPSKLKAPTKIPEKIAIVKDEEPPPAPPSTGVAGGVVGGVPGGQVGGVVGGVLGSIMPSTPVAPPKPPPPPPPAPPKRVKVSGGVTAGMALVKVAPVYPVLARQARISGTVVLQAVIGKNGRIEHLHAVKGHPLLIQSAIDAVSKWRYRPYILNGQPVEVETQITVNFKLEGG